MTAPMTRRLAITVLLIGALGACSVDQQQEIEIGRETAAKINAQLPIITDPAVADYVQQLGGSIARTTSRADLDWRFFVVDSKEVNAFALPGGFVYVNRGLIERAQRLDELAGALGHEIGHVVRRHSAQQMEKGNKANVAIGLTCTLTRLCESNVARAAIQVGGEALFARYSRKDEAEADSEAVVNVVRTGIDPEGIPVLFERLIEERQRSPGALDAFFASHPMEEDRIRATRHEIASLDPGLLRGLVRDNEQYQRFKERIASLPASPSADQLRMR